MSVRRIPGVLVDPVPEQPDRVVCTVEPEEDYLEPNIDYEDPVLSSDGETGGLDTSSLPGGVWRSLNRMHENTADRPFRVLARALRIAGADPVVIAAAKKLRCEVCDEVNKPKTRRPAALPQARRFGDVLHADLLQVTDSAGSSYWELNNIVAASRFQVASTIPSRRLRSPLLAGSGTVGPGLRHAS